jgi:hypothetical protein
VNYTIKETALTNDKAKVASKILSTLGILFTMAMAFKILPFNIAIFASGACFILAGAVWSLGRERD